MTERRSQMGPTRKNTTGTAAAPTAATNAIPAAIRIADQQIRYSSNAAMAEISRGPTPVRNTIVDAASQGAVSQTASSTRSHNREKWAVLQLVRGENRVAPAATPI